MAKPPVESPFKTYEDWHAWFKACERQFRPDDSLGDVIMCAQYETCRECPLRKGCQRRAKLYIPAADFEVIIQMAATDTALLLINMDYFTKAKQSDLKAAVRHLRRKRDDELTHYPEGYAPR